MQTIGTLPTDDQASQAGRARLGALSEDRAAVSRARELLAVLAALIAVAGVGALMVACTQI